MPSGQGEDTQVRMRVCMCVIASARFVLLRACVLGFCLHGELSSSP